MTIEFYPARKGTILIPSGSSDHLHFICSDPVFYPELSRDCVLMVNISTIKPDLHFDQTCILDAGDHPFVKHPSFVYYKKSDIFGADSISRNVADGTFSAHQECGDLVFEKILAGFNTSKEVRLKIKKFFNKYCSI